MSGPAGPSSARASPAFGLLLLTVSFAMAGALMVMPPPSGLAALLCGLAILAACGCLFLVRGFRPWGGAIAMLLSAVALTASALAARSASRDLAGLPLTIDASEERCTLSVRGDLTADLYRRLKDALDAHPGTRAVLLNSAGGTALSITHVARLLRERQVDTTAVYGQCDSACAFLWVSASRRLMIGPRWIMTVGFHAPHFRMPGIGTLRARIQDRQQRDHLQRVGLPEWFIDWAYTPVDALWRPDAEQLNRLGVANSFVQAARVEDVSFCGAEPRIVTPPAKRKLRV